MIAERGYSFQKVEPVARRNHRKGAARQETAAFTVGQAQISASRPSPRGAQALTYPALRGMGKRNWEPIAVLSISREIAKAFGASHAM